MITDRRISLTMKISFDVQKATQITDIEDLKGTIRNVVKVYYPESNPYIRMTVQYSVWDREGGE